MVTSQVFTNKTDTLVSLCINDADYHNMGWLSSSASSVVSSLQNSVIVFLEVGDSLSLVLEQGQIRHRSLPASSRDTRSFSAKLNIVKVTN